jgi:hypothetical protein
LKSKFPDPPAERGTLPQLPGNSCSYPISDNRESIIENRETVNGSDARRIPARRGKTTFPDDWKLSEEDRAGWARHGLNAAVEFASFRDNALANDRRCADWPAAFRNWCRKSLAMKEHRYVSKVQ